MLIFTLPTLFGNILAIPLLIRNSRIILAIIMPTIVPMTVAHEEKETSRLTPNKTGPKFCLHSQCYEIAIEFLTHFFSVIDFNNIIIFYLFDSIESEVI